MLGKLPLPGPLRSGLDLALLPATVLDEVSRLVPSLSTKKKTDEEALHAFGALWDQINKPGGGGGGGG
eukprot:6329236-Prymnesium_polylepis.1